MKPDSDLLEVMFNHYGLRWPRGYGDVSIKCPVHDDSHASASVNTSKGVFNCFACGAGGSAFDLVMLREGVEFTDAVAIVEKVAREGGLDVSGSLRGKSGTGVHGRSGDRSRSRPYIPSWLRQ